MDNSQFSNYETDRGMPENFNELFKFEKQLQKEEFSLIAGADEVGRGCMAGPLVAAAVILPKDVYIPNLKESKQLSHKKRVLFFNEIKKIAIATSIIIVQPEEIDRFGVHKANLKALGQAILSLNPEPEYSLIDGFSPLGLNGSFLVLKKGDERSISIAAASIIAKVTRDELMCEYHEKYPNYGFDRHKGYCTKEHLNAIMNYGLCDIHRKSFAPVRRVILQRRA
ncbi:ribonuclease HII [Candidatus Oleimmundimicrobium sp.]|uniref:ribonuclease HII n=1 Tax=Candidatus Oleimmundimicrobium sp. TaxID=3060597 RepID=UPI002718CA54|nr:ribonuclease HII [Candidatus Oleimmundimicrobium sp.]MDO8885367.1 ribonuclease HII [Candidatus Oleimmundimicrobium sp.]